MIDKIHDTATGAGVSAAAGIGYLQLGGSYWVLASAGGLIGLLHWFHAWAHADPPWTRAQSLSEATKSILFGLVVMPAAIDAAGPQLAKWGICTPSVKILIGSVAAFGSVELFGIALRFLHRKGEEV